MPIVTVWDDPQRTVIRKDFCDPWTWGDYAAALERSRAMILERPDQPVAIILNLSGIHRVPPNPLPTLRELLRDGMPANWQGTVVVGGTLFINSIARIVNEGLGTICQQVTIVQTLEAAREVLGANQQNDARV